MKKSIIVALSLFASLSLAERSSRADGDSLFQEIQQLVANVDELVTTGRFDLVPSVLADDCLGRSSITSVEPCFDMYVQEFKSLLADCGAACAGGVVLHHDLKEVARMTDSEAWGWTRATVSAPDGRRVRTYEAMNRFTRASGTWKMRRILLMHVPAAD
jgi:hypothetical protein